jgi:hypothetical protein
MRKSRFIAAFSITTLASLNVNQWSRAGLFPDSKAAGHRRHFVTQSSGGGLSPPLLSQSQETVSSASPITIRIVIPKTIQSGTARSSAHQVSRLLTHSSPSQLCSFPQWREPNEHRPLRLAFPQRPRSPPSVLVAKRRAVARLSCAP